MLRETFHHLIPLFYEPFACAESGKDGNVDASSEQHAHDRHGPQYIEQHARKVAAGVICWDGYSESREKERFGYNQPGQAHAYEVKLGPDCIREATKLYQAVDNVSFGERRGDHWRLLVLSIHDNSFAPASYARLCCAPAGFSDIVKRLRLAAEEHETGTPKNVSVAPPAHIQFSGASSAVL